MSTRVRRSGTSRSGTRGNWSHRDVRRRLGDSLYDFSVQPPKQRCGVHGPGNIETDLRGKYALLSEHFFYFGDKPERLPNDLLPIVRQGQGHQCNLNAPYFERFVTWIHSLGYKPNTLMGKPQLKLIELGHDFYGPEVEHNPIGCDA